MSARADVEFASGDATCAAWLYLPEGAGPHAVVVMGHGLGAVREMRLDAYAERFVAAGYACLVFDYRHFGASGGEPRQLLDIGRELEDWRSAVAYARTRPELDPDRVVVWGTSFGGGHAIVTAADDPRIAAAVAQCPFTDGLASGLAIPPVTSARATVRWAQDAVAARRGDAPVMIDIAGEPGSVALMTALDAKPGYFGLLPPGAPFREQVAARVLLPIIAHRPGRAAARVRCPILFSVCLTDSVAPARATLRHAARAPRGEVIGYPFGHFDIYVGAPFEQAVADQVAFVARHVPAG